MRALKYIPPIVFSSAARRRLKVDLFPGGLPYVGYKKVASGPIESAAPRVAQAIDPDLIQPGNPDERIVRRHGVVAIRVPRKIVAVNIHEIGRAHVCTPVT